MCTLRGGSNYSTTPWFFQKLCCTFSVLVSHIWGIKMNILQKLFQGKCIPVSEHGGNSSCEYEVAVEKLCKIAENLRQYGVPEELISALDKAENEILALEEKRMFRFAIRYRAELQRELMRKGQAIGQRQIRKFLCRVRCNSVKWVTPFPFVIMLQSGSLADFPVFPPS